MSAVPSIILATDIEAWGRADRRSILLHELPLQIAVERVGLQVTTFGGAQFYS